MPAYSYADSISVKNTAPEVYVVKKGDTLWDISNMYLDKSWQWPQLWRTNIHITNPHLIYPGDKLRLVKNNEGEIFLEVVRVPLKPLIKLYPEVSKSFKTPEAIAALPWSVIKPYIENEMIMSQEAYDRYPYILGNQEGAVRFSTDNIVLGKASYHSKDDLNIVRMQHEIYDMGGNFIGLQIRYIARAKLINADVGKQTLIKILQAKLEVKRGDKIIPAVINEPDNILLTAAENQTGYIIDDLEQHNLLGKYNVVVLDVGLDQVSAGTIMGIYSQGPRIIDGKQPKYEGEADRNRSAFNQGDKISQPALKIGEVVVFKAFDKASYALITKSARVIKRGMIVARP
jgi:LysM repeat protein